MSGIMIKMGKAVLTNLTNNIMVNSLLHSQDLIHISPPPPVPPTFNLSFNTQTEDLVHAGVIDSSDGRVLALHARGPGFESW